jgi:DNA primase
MKPQEYKGIISGDKIEEIRRAANIREIVSEYITLKKTGRSYVGLCPFHAEKTPSFHVSEEKGSFKCFGCGAGGDLFRFYMMITGASFPEAVRDIAKRYGISVPRRPLSPRKQEEIDQKQNLYAINEEAARFFRNQLQGPTGGAPRRYLSDRAISPACIEMFGLGYAPPHWEGLVTYLKAKGFSFESALKVGLIRTGQRDDSYYDYFRDRVMFPIQDSQGRIIGFGGRILEKGEPKYLNSPETPIYSKGSSLYGLFQARQAIQREGLIILVEGYFDLLSLFSHGISNGVAPLGTAVTQAQLQILKRYSRSLMVVFDGDDAGVKAMARALPLFLAEGLEARVVVLPEGQDPDDFVRREGADTFRALMEHAPAVMDFYLRWLMQQVDTGTVEGKRNVLQQMVPHLSAITDPISRGLYIEHVAQRIGVRSEQIATLLQNIQEKRDNFPAHPGPEGHTYDSTEHLLMRLIFQHPDMLPSVEKTGVLDDFHDPEMVRLIPWIQRCLEVEGILNPDIVIQMVEDERLQELVAQLAYFDTEGIIDKLKTMEDCIFKIRGRNIQKELERNRNFIQEAQGRGDQGRVNALLLEQQDLVKRRKQLQALKQNLI